jgi:hypothetical protein
MAEKSLFFNSITGDTRSYNADDWASYFDRFIETGIYSYADNLAVTAAGTNMSVDVGVGIAFIGGRMYENTALLNLAVDTAEITDDRIDLVVVRLDNNQSARYIKCFVKKGTPSATPVAPTLQNDAYVQEIALAEIFVTAGKSFIDSTQLTDKRSTDYVNPFVDGNRLNTAEDNIANHETRITSAESTITSHGTRLTTAESDISGLKTTDTSHNTRITTVEGKLVQSDRTPQTLTYGTSLINGVTSSPLDVQIEGKTLVNHPGKEGGFHKQGKWDGNLTIDTANYKFGTSSGKIDNSAGTSGKTSTNTQKMHVIGKYILVGIWMKANSGNPTVNFHLQERDSAGNFVKNNSKQVGLTSSWQFYYLKVDLTSSTSDHCYLALSVNSYGTSDAIVIFDGFSAYDIPKSDYDKIGVSLTDQQVADMFPYVDSVQHNQNPIVTVEGENLIPPFYEWTLHANAKALEPYKLELNATANHQITSYVAKCIPNQTYTIKFQGNGAIYVHTIDSAGNTISTKVGAGGTTSQGTYSFTTENNAHTFRIEFTSGALGSGLFTFEQPMLNLGSTAKPFVPRNPSHLYASVKLGELSGKKDILFKENGEWKVRKEVEKDVVLDGSKAWSYHSDSTGYKMAKITLSPVAIKDSQIALKYDGSILKRVNAGVANTAGDQVTTSSTGDILYISIADTDTGWSDAWTGTELTADWIKAYFNGWKYTGDGTTHSWQSLTGTEVANSIEETKVKPSGGGGFEPVPDPYMLSYVLATPQNVVVTDKVEGDLSISGLAQASVDGGVIVREKANPILSSGKYHINLNSLSATKLKNKAGKIVYVFKNGIADKKWVILENRTDAFGTTRAEILEADYDSTSEYSCSYVVLDKYKLTVNPLSVPIWYNGNLAGAVANTVARQSDMATQISVNVAAIVDLYARVKALGG